MDHTTGSDRAIYAVEGRRKRRRLWILPVLVIVAAALVVGIFLAVENSRAVSFGAISPAPDAFLSSKPLTVTCELSRFVPGRGSVTVTVDGQPAPAGDVTLAAGQVQARLSLTDGRHAVTFAYDSSGLLSRHLDRTIAFTVDTVAPVATVGSPASFPLLQTASSDVEFAFSEAATARLTLDGAEVPVDVAGAATKIKAKLATIEGEHKLTLTATDSAGNAKDQSWDLVVDEKAPELAAKGLPDAETWKKQTSAAVTVTATDHFADRLELVATLDGTDLDVEQETADGADQRVFTFDTGSLAEGTHSVEVSATDVAGHVTALKRDFLVDTSSTFGARPLKTGALGDDVKQLQRILKIKGVYTGDPTGTLDDSTAAAVAKYNSECGLAGGSAATTETLKYLLGHIQIDLSERKLRLYSGDDKLIKTYGVAVGMPAHPTPVGAFRVIVKERNPTWNPPDSAWAAGMGPVAPGPNNPLGTRWMGLNSPGIGMHGTPTPSSIGSAASHGCIRMRIPEAEDLFDRIFVGTPVEIVK